MAGVNRSGAGANTQTLQPRGGGLAGVVVGLTYPFRAMKVLGQYPTLRPYVIAPVVLNVLLGITLYATSVWWGLRLIDHWMAHLVDWVQPTWLDAGLQVLAPIIQALLMLALFVVTGLVLLQFGVILGSPFYGQLSEKLESLRVGQLPPAEPLTLGSVLRDIRRAILFEFKKLLLLVGIGLPLVALNLLPGLGTTIATVGGLSLAVTILCLDMFDAALERRRLKFRQKLGIILGSFPASAGFGLVSLGLVSIPLMNLLAIPLCVTAGTLFFCDRILVVPPPAPAEKS
jgi:CysZ protein